MPRVELIEVQGVIQTGGEPGAGTVTLETLGADTLALISGGSGATTIADGADVAQGAKADAVWSGSGDGTVIAILKSARNLLSTLAGAISGGRMNSNIQRSGAASSVSIANGTTESAAINLSANITGGFVTPSAMTGSSFTYKAAHLSGTYYPLYDQYGNLVTTPISTSQSRAYPFPQEAAGFAYLVLVSSAAEGATRTINLFQKG